MERNSRRYRHATRNQNHPDAQVSRRRQEHALRLEKLEERTLLAIVAGPEEIGTPYEVAPAATADPPDLHSTFGSSAPRASVEGPAFGLIGSSHRFTFSATDSLVDMLLGFRYEIDWGDGATETIRGPAWEVSRSHAYADFGDYLISVTATNRHGRTGPAAGQAFAARFIIDDGDAGFGLEGKWSKLSVGLDHDSRLRSTSGSGAAKYTFTNLEPGNYHVYATWPQRVAMNGNAQYTINGSTQLTVDQRRTPDDLSDLGVGWERITAAAGIRITGSTLEVRLPNAPTGTVADAIQLRPVTAVPFVDLVDQRVSTSTARDGQTITLEYQIDASAGTTATLTGHLVSPAGVVIADLDPGHEQTVALAEGVQWYQRPFTVNLPPQAETDQLYTVVWTVQWGEGNSDSAADATGLSVLAPVGVRVPILMYHNVQPVATNEYIVTPEALRSQLLALKEYGYTPVSVEEVMAFRAGAAAPAKPVLVTFDDGYRGVLTYALPVLEELDFKATLFVMTDAVREDSAPVNPLDPGITLSWNDLAQLRDSGRVEIQSHSVTHPFLSTLAPVDLMAELVDSKQQLESHLGTPIHFISWPYGDYNLDVQRAAWEVGYVGGIGAWGGTEPDATDKWALKRIYVDWNTSVNTYPDAGKFLFAAIGDPDVPVPQVSLGALQYLDAGGHPLDFNRIAAGQSVRVRLNATNSGETSVVVASLRLDSDGDHDNGVFYDSHTAVPSGDAQTTLAAGQQQTFEWLWAVPETAPLGQYYASVRLQDERFVLGLADSGWDTAFMVVPNTPFVNLVDQRVSTSTARDGQTITLEYQIDASAGMTAALAGHLVSPAGVVIADLDPGHEQTVALAEGPQWYQRQFTINLPPQAATDQFYTVVWTVEWGDSQADSAVDATALSVLAPVDVRVPILMYHNVQPVATNEYTVTPEAFRAQLLALRENGYTPVTMADVMAFRAGEPGPAKPVLVTFDDGYQGVLTYALPVLEELDFKATLFVMTGVMREASDPGNPLDPSNSLSWSELAVLRDSGRVELQSHSVSHPFLSTLAPDDLMAELVDSKQQLESYLGTPIHFISWPYGDTSSAVQEAAWRAGYFAALGAWGGTEPDAADKWALKRVYVDWLMSAEALLAELES